MSEIVARWEWRSFGRRFPAAEACLSRLTPSGVQESEEVYLLSGSGDNVKIRDALMDVKVLRETNPDGLEQWIPVMKAGFPLSATETAKVLGALHRPVPAPLAERYALDAFLAAFAGPDSGIRVVRVHKRRVRYMLDSCMAELSDILANGKPTRTVAVESEDPAAVVRAVATLGLGGHVNVSYPRALPAVLDDEPERYAVIDVGTNSVKFHIGARDPKGGWQTVTDRAEVTRLGEGLAETGLIGDAPLERTVAAISGMVDEARQSGLRAIAAVGTAGLRIARNGAEVASAIRARTGLQVDVISGEDEARLAYLATVAALGSTAGTLVVFDTGGGSSQFTFGHGTAIDERFSVDVGAARYTERFGLGGAVSQEKLKDAMAAIAADLGRLDGRPVPNALVGMGGAVTNLTAVKHGLATYDPSIVQGTILERSEIDRQIELYRSRSADERRSIVGLQPARAEVILAGACIVRTVMEKLGKTSLTVSDRGLRHGVLAERFGTRAADAGRRPAGETLSGAREMIANKPPQPPSSAQAQSMSGEDMLKVFELLKGATSVELKLTVPDKSRRAAVKRLGFDPVEAEPRQAYFFDTPDLALNRAGVVVRARRIQGGGGDTVVKLRPVDPAKLDPELRKAAGFKIELDAMPGGYVCSASYKGACTGQEVLDVTEGRAPLESLFSREQRDFYSANAPAEIKLNALVPLGPTFLLRIKHQPKAFDRRLTVELWLYPDGSRIFEISTKCGTEEAFQVGMEFRALMAKCGIPIEPCQETKTNSALQFFRDEIGQGKGSPARNHADEGAMA